MACSSAQMMNLLQTTEVTSRDFADVKALVEGRWILSWGSSFTV